MSSRALMRSQRNPTARGEVIWRCAAVYFVPVEADQARASCWGGTVTVVAGGGHLILCFRAATHACQP